MSCSILLFLWNTTIGLLSNTLRNSGLICSMCQIFLTIYDMFGSVQLYVNTSGMLFLLLIFSLFCKSSFCSVKSYSNCLHYISIPKDIIGEVNCKICVGSSFSQISFINPFSLTDFIESFSPFLNFWVQALKFYTYFICNYRSLNGFRRVLKNHASSGVDLNVIHINSFHATNLFW